MGTHKSLQIGGKDVDISHALVGLDAELDTSAPESNLWMISDAHRTPAATWAGDLGSAMAHWGHKTSGPDSVDAYIAKYASKADLLGDIDGINLAHLGLVGRVDERRTGTSAASLGSADTLGERLRAYYADRAGSGDSFIVRYVPFAVSQGLAFDQSGTLSDNATNYIENQVVEAAFLVTASIGAKSLSDSGRDGEGQPQAPLPAADESTPGGVHAAASYDPAVDVKNFVTPFIDWLEDGIRSEINHQLSTYEELRESFEAAN